MAHSVMSSRERTRVPRLRHHLSPRRERGQTDPSPRRDRSVPWRPPTSTTT